MVYNGSRERRTVRKSPLPRKNLGHSYTVPHRTVPYGSVHKCKDRFIVILILKTSLIFLTRVAYSRYTHGHNTQGSTPPRAFFEADVLDNGESASAERCVYGKTSTRSSQINPSRSVLPPAPWLGGNRFRGVCYHILRGTF